MNDKVDPKAQDAINAIFGVIRDGEYVPPVKDSVPAPIPAIQHASRPMPDNEVKFDVYIRDENISGEFHYRVCFPCSDQGIDESQFEELCAAEIALIRDDAVGKWYSFVDGLGDVLLNSAYYIRIEAVGATHIDLIVNEDED